jgi:hypothetical protein
MATGSSLIRVLCQTDCLSRTRAIVAAELVLFPILSVHLHHGSGHCNHDFRSSRPGVFDRTAAESDSMSSAPDSGTRA